MGSSFAKGLKASIFGDGNDKDEKKDGSKPKT